MRHFPDTNLQIPPKKAKWVSMALVVELFCYSYARNISKSSQTLHKFSIFPFLLKNFVLFSSKMDTTNLIRSPLVVLYLLIKKILKHCSQTTWRSNINWKFSDDSSIFVSNWSTFILETGIYPFKKLTRQRIQLLLNSFRVLIHEIVENNIKTVNWEIKNSRKMIVLTILGSLWLYFLPKLHSSPRTTLMNNKFIHCWTFCFQRSDPWNLLKLWQRLHKNVKNQLTLTFLSFWSQFQPFFIRKRR